MQLESRIEARFSVFPLIAVTGYRFHAASRNELIGYFVRFGHPILFCIFFTVKTKAYNIIMSHTIQL